VAEQVVLQVPAALDGARVDRAIAHLLEVSRATAALLWDEGVTVDGRGVRPSERVSTGDVIICTRPEAASSLVAEDVPFGILFADEDVLVVDKPAGVVVHPGSGRSAGTLAAGLLNGYPELAGVGAEDCWGLVHRLDKDTSGAILVGRNAVAFEALVDDLRRRRVGRTYLALVEGTMGSPTGTIEAPIGRDPARPMRRAVTHTGKHARTHYEVVTYYEGSDATLLEVTLDTGRTHQIRVHLSAIGHPVVGDRTYGASRLDLSPPRTFLHASRLDFDHPTTGIRMSVEAPLPADLAGVLDRLT